MERAGKRNANWFLILLALLLIGAGAALLQHLFEPQKDSSRLKEKPHAIQSRETLSGHKKEPAPKFTSPKTTATAVEPKPGVSKIPPVAKHRSESKSIDKKEDATGESMHKSLHEAPIDLFGPPDDEYIPNTEAEELFGPPDSDDVVYEADGVDEVEFMGDETISDESAVVDSDASGEAVIEEQQYDKDKTPGVAANYSQVPDIIMEAEPNSSDGIQEGYVVIRVSKYRGSLFYRVMINEEEMPYIDIQGALETWLDLTADCKIGRKYCQTTLRPTQKIYWLDAKSLQMGNSDDGVIDIPADAIIERENKIWLRYDLWPQWLPMKTNWTMQSYILGFYPNFPSLVELKETRKNNRKILQAQKEKKEDMEKIVPIMPAAMSAIQARYRLQYDRSSSSDETNVLGDYDLMVDLMGGTFITGGHRDVVLDASNEVTENEGDTDYWRYTFRNKKHFSLLEFGDTWYKSSLLVPSVIVSDGVQLNRLEREHGAGKFELSDRTRPGTEIDVFLNGFLLKTIIVGHDGLYTIEEQYVSGGDYINLRFYFPDGSEREDVIRIAPDNALILEPGEWDTQLITGDTDAGQFNHAGLRLGTGFSSSIGVHAYEFPVTDGSDPAYGLDAAWRPFNSLSLSWERLYFEHGEDYTVRADYTGIPLNTFQIEHQSIHTESPLYAMSSTQLQSTDLWKLRHFFRYDGWSWRGEYIDSVERDAFNASLNKRFNQKYSSYVETQNEWNDEQRFLDYKKVGVTYTPDKSTMVDINRGWTPETTTWSINYRLQKGGKSRNWDLNLHAIYTEGGSTESATILWRLSRNMSTSFTASNDEFHVRFIWTDIIAQKPGPAFWDEFGTGTLAGTLLMPKTDGEPPQPYKDIIVRADTKRAKTNEKGEYAITGLPPDQRVAVSVDDTSLDASVVPEQDIVVAYFRPGTRIDYNPKIVWTIGIDGYLIHTIPIPEEAAIKIVRHQDNKLIKTVAVESDGFFIAEGLSAGKYVLYLTDVENPPPPLNIVIPAGSDWVSNINWQWR